MQKKRKRKNENGDQHNRRMIDKSHRIDSMYNALRDTGGAIFRGFAFGEFGVSKQVAIGAAQPALGSTLKLTFKTMGFHAFSQSKTVRAIRSKGAKSKLGV